MRYFDNFVASISISAYANGTRVTMVFVPSRPLRCIHSSTLSVGERRWLYRLKLHLFDLLHNKSTTNRQEIEPMEFESYRTCHARLPSTRRRQVLSTPDRPLSRFISHLPTVRVPWRNLLSPEFKEEKTLIFGHSLISLKHSEGNPACKKSARSVQPFWYNTGMWRTDGHTATDNTRAGIASHG